MPGSEQFFQSRAREQGFEWYLIYCCGAAFKDHSLFCNLLIAFAEIEGSGVVRVIRKKKEPSNCNGKGYYRVDNEEPLPATKAIDAIEVIHSCHKIAREHSTNGSGCVKDAGSHCQLVFAIPRPDTVRQKSVKPNLDSPNNILHSWIKAALSEANEEA